jgi:hypothetical protein
VNPNHVPELPAPAQRLRLLKAVVQLVFVIDDGETLSERVAEPVVVPASVWPTWASDGYPQLLLQLQAEIDREHSADEI